ncbi:hypothetical protein I552_4400 [Mycobacterium xenopi 3993]|nr:hypothetical protein I552_4400 [Mycobacterium xenopi 3993]
MEVGDVRNPLLKTYLAAPMATDRFPGGPSRQWWLLTAQQSSYGCLDWAA